MMYELLSLKGPLIVKITVDQTALDAYTNGSVMDDCTQDEDPTNDVELWATVVGYHHKEDVPQWRLKMHYGSNWGILGLVILARL